MIFNLGFAVLCIAFGLNVAQSTSLPSYIQICRLSDPNLEGCVLNSIEKIKPYLKKGIPELAIPPAEPLFIPELGVPGGPDNGVVAVGRNIKVYGASDFTVEKLKLDFSNPSRPTIHFAFNLPHLKFDGDYEVNTRILVLPIKGKGPIKFDAFNTKADAILYGHTYKKGNNNYVRFNRMDLSLHMQDYSVHLGNLFNGDKLLEQATNQALNENKDEFKKALNPTVTKSIIELILQFANDLAKNQPYDVLFPN
ncbi:hypothetical protein RUM43_001098 [Polyplax serrata]|uniref:Uncharacterized protein n=1 Tax=Polyplax serrata TaxID=468196 RepID=A0AAN8SI81_POLSC